MAAALCGALAASGCSGRAEEAVAPAPRADVAEAVAAFHAGREHHRLWLDARGRMRPGAEAALGLILAAEADGLDPARYRASDVARLLKATAGGDARAARRADRALSAAWTAYLSDLRTPRPENAPVFADPGLAAGAAASPRARLEALASAPDLAERVRADARMHPLYEELKRALAAHRAAKGEAETERLLRINLDRARALPFEPGLHVVVDAAAARLVVYEGVRAVETMKVVVGEPAYPTPVLHGLIRYAVYQPYWNVPEDLAQTRVAAAVLREGPRYLEARRMEVLSDWSAAARPVDPRTIDWRAAAERRLSVRVRQRPGPDNMMGRVKFMLPNALGIYLHDTPSKDLFARTDRALSAGCVRVENPDRLAALLFRGAAPPVAAGAAEHAADLPRPVPVYITYLTIAPAADGRLERRPDVYRRDRAAPAAPPRRYGPDA